MLSGDRPEKETTSKRCEVSRTKIFYDYISTMIFSSKSPKSIGGTISRSR